MIEFNKLTALTQSSIASYTDYKAVTLHNMIAFNCNFLQLLCIIGITKELINIQCHIF